MHERRSTVADIKEVIIDATHTSSDHQVVDSSIIAAQTTLYDYFSTSGWLVKISDFLKVNKGSLVISAALFLQLAKLISEIVSFVKARNKNLSAHTGLAWALIKGLGLTAVIVGSILFAAPFVLGAPIAFVVTAGLDTLRSIFLFGWNVVRLAMLSVSVRNSDELTQLKAEKLKIVYTENIKNNFIGSVAGLLGTLATVVIFLFPHVGLSSVTAAVITIGTLKTTVGTALGVMASVGMCLPLVVPPVVNLAYGICNVGKKLFNAVFSSSRVEPVRPAPQNQNESEPLVQRPKYQIKNVADLATAIVHTMPHNAHMDRSEFREIVINHIDPEQPLLALTAIRDMVSEKIKVLEKEYQSDSWIDRLQKGKRLQKLEALKDIKNYLDFNEVKDAALSVIICDVDGLIKYIDRTYPKVNDSFFRHVSDTQNILAALKAYEKFDRHERVVNIRQGKEEERIAKRRNDAVLAHSQQRPSLPST